jgi:hypothetical protein
MALSSQAQPGERVFNGDRPGISMDGTNRRLDNIAITRRAIPGLIGQHRMARPDPIMRQRPTGDSGTASRSSRHGGDATFHDARNPDDRPTCRLNGLWGALGCGAKPCTWQGEATTTPDRFDCGGIEPHPALQAV